LKILHIVQRIDKKGGGIVSALINILRIEKSIGMQSTVVSVRGEELDPVLLESATINILKPSFPVRFSRSKEANNWLGKNVQNYDLVMIHSVWGCLPIEASRISYNQRIPYVIWTHGSLDPSDLQKKKYAKKLLGPIMIRPILDRSGAIVCTAEMEAERLERYGAKARPKVLPLPINPPVKPGERERFRKKFLLNDDDFVLLFLSRIDYIKGLNFLVPAMEKISANCPNIKLVIAGANWNGYEQNVRSWILEYKLEERVIIAGFLSGQDKYDAFAGSDCFVLPSMKENFGISVVEALSAGLPVMISNGVYIWEKIVRNGGGWACDYSLESVTETITNILNSPFELKSKRENARRVAELFSPEHLKPLYERFYQQVASKC